MESGDKETGSKHGGKRSKQGRETQAFKDMKDASNFPRIQGFFNAISSPFLGADGTGKTNPDYVGPTKRSRADVANASSPSTFALQ